MRIVTIALMCCVLLISGGCAGAPQIYQGYAGIGKSANEVGALVMDMREADGCIWIARSAFGNKETSESMLRNFEIVSVKLGSDEIVKGLPIGIGQNKNRGNVGSVIELQPGSSYDVGYKLVAYKSKGKAIAESFIPLGVLTGALATKADMTYTKTPLIKANTMYDVCCKYESMSCEILESPINYSAYLSGENGPKKRFEE